MVRRTWCVAAALLALSGCAPGNPGLIVGGVIEPDEACMVNEAGFRLVRGTLDTTAARISYTINPLLYSQLINLSSMSAPPRADPNTINLVRAEVELRDLNGAPFALSGPNPYSVPATGLVLSAMIGAMGMPALGWGTAEIIPPAYGEDLRGIEEGTVVAAVRVVGITAGGAELVSPEFLWPIDLCAGCLFSCVRGTEGEALCVPSCRFGQDVVSVTPSACASPEFVEPCIPGGV